MQEAGEPISDDELKELKALVVALGVAEGVKGSSRGLKAPGCTAASVRTGELGNQIDRIGPCLAFRPKWPRLNWLTCWTPVSARGLRW